MQRNRKLSSVLTREKMNLPELAAITLLAERRAIVQTHCGAVQHAVAQTYDSKAEVIKASQVKYGNRIAVAHIWSSDRTGQLT